MSDIFTLSSEVVDELIERQPELSTFIGAPGRDHLWGDRSPASFADLRSLWAEVLERATDCEVESRADQVAKAVLVAEADREIRSIDAGLHLNDLNNIESPWQSIREIFDSMPDHTVEAWENIIRRLETIEQPLADYRACLTLGLERGDVAARRQAEAAIDQGRKAAGSTSGLTVLLDRFDDNRIENPALGDTLRTEVESAIETARASIGRATDWLEETYLPSARASDGVGRKRYVAAAERFLGESIDPEQIYSWGWSEIARLQARLGELCASIDPVARPSDVVRRLGTDPAFGVEGVDAFIETMLARQQTALTELDGSHFDVPEPVKQIEVKPAPPGGALSPYYTSPSEDFSRAGCVWYPIGERTFFPLYDEITTAYHEGFPGHHLQVGWQNAMGDELSRFHRLLVWYPGSGEGWALYAEHMMGELGYLEEPSYEIGLVTSQLFRSARVVIDIGWHCGLTIPGNQPFHPGESWSFDLATEMLRDIAFATAPLAESEAIRYAGWPGQAISYKVGERAILELRDEMAQAPDFDLKAFHAKLLSVGSIGLDLMRDLVRSP
jgi:uncharacterized protein (DUF885 family)